MNHATQPILGSEWQKKRVDFIYFNIYIGWLGFSCPQTWMTCGLDVPTMSCDVPHPCGKPGKNTVLGGLSKQKKKKKTGG